MSEQVRNTKSAELLERAKEVIPRGINSSGRMQLMENRDGEPVCFEKASGAELVDMEGNEYIDYINAWGPIILGHCHEEVDRAVAEASKKRDIIGGSTSELEVKAAELVVEHVPSAEMVQFGTTGSEVVAHAVRTARGRTRRRKIIKFEGNYHGWYDPIATNYMTTEKYLGKKFPMTTGLLSEATEETIILPYNDIDAVRQTFEDHPDEIAGVIVEPVAHNIGCVPPVDGFLEGLREVTEEYGAMLIFDEVITGFRHGMGGVQGREGVTPDLTTMAKAVGNGYPVSLLCGPEEYMQEYNQFRDKPSVYFAGTYNAHTASMAAVVETLRQLDEQDVHTRLENIRIEMANGIRDHLEDADVDGFIKEYGTVFGTYFGDGPVNRYEDLLELDKERFLEYNWEMFDRGILMPPKFPRANLLNASLTEQHVEKTIEAAGEAIDAIAADD